MLNGKTLNSGSLNSSAFAFISAVAAFSAGTASTDFAEGNIIKAGTATMQSYSTVTSFNATKIGALVSNPTPVLQFHAKPSMQRAAQSDWIIDIGLPGISAQVDTSVDFNTSTSIEIYTDFVFAEMHISVNTSEMSADGRRVDFLFAAVTASGNFTNNIEPQINGLMTGAWTSDPSIWIEPTVDRNLGYINHEGYSFWGAELSWETTSYLVELFTTGGFTSSGAHLEAPATKVIFASSKNWSSSCTTSFKAVTNQRASSNSNQSIDFGADALRTAYGISDAWEQNCLVEAEALMTLAGRWDLANEAQLTLPPTMIFGGRSNFEVSGEVSLSPIIWKQGKAIFKPAFNKQTSKIEMKAVKLLTANMAVVASGNATKFNSLRTAYGSMNVSGLGATISVAAALRLVDAPSFRKFIVKKQNRTFIVPGKDTKLEVAT